MTSAVGPLLAMVAVSFAWTCHGPNTSPQPSGDPGAHVKNPFAVTGVELELDDATAAMCGRVSNATAYDR